MKLFKNTFFLDFGHGKTVIWGICDILHALVYKDGRIQCTGYLSSRVLSYFALGVRARSLVRSFVR